METDGINQEVDKMCNLGEILYEDAYLEGEEQGIEKGLVQLISKKLSNGKSIAAIADELEETEEKIAELIKKYNL